MVKIEFNESEVEKYRGLKTIKEDENGESRMFQIKCLSNDLIHHLDDHFSSFKIAGQEWRFLYGSRDVKSERITTNRSDRTIVKCKQIFNVMNILYCI